VWSRWLTLETLAPRLFFDVMGSRAGSEAKFRLLFRTTGRIGLELSDGDRMSSTVASTSSAAATGRGTKVCAGAFVGDALIGDP